MRPSSPGSKVKPNPCVSRDYPISTRDSVHLANNRDGVASETSSAAASRGVPEQSVCCVLPREGGLMKTAEGLRIPNRSVVGCLSSGNRPLREPSKCGEHGQKRYDRRYGVGWCTCLWRRDETPGINCIRVEIGSCAEYALKPVHTTL